MSKKVSNYYQVSDENWQRIHFARPRFKSNIENVLLYMANECCKIGTSPCNEYSDRYYNAIKMFPGNIDKTQKTLNNWRTEIPALFGFYVEDKAHNVTKTSKMAMFLHENQDLTQFLRLFLLSFQFPGGHIKASELQDIIRNNIKFKPAQLLLKVLLAGNEILASQESEKEMNLTAEEATYCIFNDIRVTSGEIAPKKVAETILFNRKNKIKYYNRLDPHVFNRRGIPMSQGDVTRYAMDILDYMEIANLVEKNHSRYYYLKPNEGEAINVFVNDKTFFCGYDKFYEKEGSSVSEISVVEAEWYDYVNNSMNPDLIKTEVTSLFVQGDKIKIIVDERISQVLSSDLTTKKDIGNLGEALVYGHEKRRLKDAGYIDLANFVQIVDSPSYHPGFDIDSLEGDGTQNHRYIEVKTTISKRKIQLYDFHMSTNEWNVANTIQSHYCVYRLMISEEDRFLYILRNPVMMYKTDVIEAIPRGGMDITFDASKFNTTELLLWKD